MDKLHKWNEYPEVQMYKLMKSNVAAISDQWIKEC